MSRKGVVGRTGARFGSAAMREVWEEAESEEAELPPEDDDSITELTGARFGSPALRRRWKEEAEQARQRAEAEEPQPVPPPPPEPEPAPTALIELEPPAPPRRPETEWDEPPASMIRPYAHTAGRTRTDLVLPLEALISTTGRCPLGDRPPEWRTIAELCVVPRSVAEVAAMLALPVAVARVLIADMARSDAITAHDTAGTANAAPSRATLERVLEGLRRL